MKKYIIIFVLLILPMRLFSQAQDSTIVIQEIIPNLIDGSVSVPDSIINDGLSSVQTEGDGCETLLSYKDSVINSLSTENEILKAKVNRADSLIIRIMNNRLVSRFKKDNIIEAISDYNNITSQKLKEEFKYRETLLKSYEGYYNDIVSFLKNIQQDKMRTNPFFGEKYKEKCLRAFEGVSYYRYYKGNDDEKKIPYLEHIMALVENELNKHGSKDAMGREYYSNFESILEELTN